MYFAYNKKTIKVEDSKNNNKNLKQQLLKLKFSQLKNPQSGQFPLSNDIPYCGAQLIMFYYRLLPNMINKGPKDVAIIIGNGNVLTFLNSLPNNIIVIDAGDKVINHLKQSISIIKNTKKSYSKKKESYINSVKSNGLEEAYDLKSLDKLHFLANKERDIETQILLKSKNIVVLQMNFLDISNIKKIANTLNKNNYRISFLNLTNLQSYDSDNKLPEAITLLPFSKKFVAINTVFYNFKLLNGEFLYAESKKALLYNIKHARKHSDINNKNRFVNNFKKFY